MSHTHCWMLADGHLQCAPQAGGKGCCMAAIDERCEFHVASYHDGIQAAAKVVEAERAKTYRRGGSGVSETIKWSEREMTYILAIIYKALRVKNETMSRDKAKDDVIDMYNFCALLYEQLEGKFQ